MNNPENPSFVDIEETIRNVAYKDKNVSFELQASNDENHEFKFSLKGNGEDIDFTIDTRIAIERHDSRKGHPNTHLQWEISKTDSKFFHNGVLHITLLVNSSQELLECCLGFTSILGEVLNFFEKELKLKENKLLDYFFNEKIHEFKNHKKTLFNFIEKSYIEDKIFVKSNEPLIEIKNRKADDHSMLNQNKKIFFMLRLIFENPMLRPLLEIPTCNRFIKIPQIKRINLTNKQARDVVYTMLEGNHDLEKYTPEKFLIEHQKIK